MAKRENSSGSIVKRKRVSGFVYEAYTPAFYTTTPDGKRICHRQLLGRFKKRSDARSVLDEFSKHPTTKYNITLQDLYNEYKSFAFANLSNQTVTNYTSAWAKISNYPYQNMPQKIFREIATSDLREVFTYYQTQLSMSYITKIKSLLTQLYRYAMENNIVDRDYVSLIRLKDASPKRPSKRAFTSDEFSILENNWQSIPGGDAVYALCYLGFRVTEFCLLKVSDYDPNKKVLYGGIKTDAGRNRAVPVHKKIQPIIEGWIENSDRVLYPSRNGEHYNKDSFRNVWNKVIKELGLPDDLTPHSARHTCGTMLSASGARPEDIKQILGHEDYTMTANTYINQDVKTLTDAMNLIK